jgi:hypothetical protein
MILISSLIRLFHKCLPLLTFLLGSFSLPAQEFSPEDVRLGDPQVNYVNPEISPIGNYMVWIEIDTANGFSGKVWHCGLDPETGDLIPENGKGFNPFTSNVYGRPADWGWDSKGPYYMGINLQGQFVFVRPSGPTTAEVEVLPTEPDVKRRVIYPSQLPDTNKRFVTYILNENTAGGANNPANNSFDLRFLDLDDPTNERTIETQTRRFPAAVGMDVLVPRWIKGTSHLTYGFYDNDNFIQVKEFDAFNPSSPPKPVTSDQTIKADGYPVNNPFNNSQYLISGLNGTDTAIVYRRNTTGEEFKPIETIIPRTRNLEIPALNQSHEPFFFDDQLFTTFQINNDGGSFVNTTLNEPGEIWIASIDAAQQSMWLISEYDSTLNISEPEPYPAPEKIFVYYSANSIDPDNSPLNRIFQLRRAETPMNDRVTFSKEEKRRDSPRITLYPSFPNPFSAQTVFTFELSEPEEITVSVYNLKGQLIRRLFRGYRPSGMQRITVDASNWRAGIYLLVVDAFNSKRMQKFTVVK